MNSNEIKGEIVDDNSITKYVDEFGNEIDPSLIDENGNFKGVTEYVDEYGNPIDPSLIDEKGNYIGEKNEELILSSSEHQMDDKELFNGMVTFDYNNVPITDIVNSIILDAIAKGASDIHFDPFDGGIKVRLRIDGSLNDYSIVPLFVKKNMITRIKIISGMNITESRVPQDGAIRSEINGKTIDIRVSSLPTNLGEKIVLRIMDYSMSASGIEALDFSEQNLEKVKKMLSLPNGIILVTGATGTGKSTTVYSMLQKLNIEGSNLVTVEDPIEMNIPGINQVQAQSEIGLNFATVLRSILRQDPDIIMIGEIRDDETARIAVRASITGHLVLSTIHTNNSLNTIERLTDMSVERYLLGSSLSGIVSQKLSRRLCEKCKRLRPTTDYEKEIFKKVLDKDIENIYEPVGCSECSRGYRGRIAIHEVLLLNQTIKDAITKGTQKSILRKLVYGNDGTETMLQDGLNKVLAGKTSFEEILKLIDLDDDLGSDTQLGLDEQINASAMVNNPTNLISNQPININITEEVLKNLNMLNKASENVDKPVIEEEIEIPKTIDEEIEKEDKLDYIQENVEEEKEKTNFELLEELDDKKYDLSKKEYNDQLNKLLNDIDIDKLEDQDEMDNYLIHLSLIEGDSLIYKNNNKLIKELIDKLNDNSEYLMESDNVDEVEIDDIQGNSDEYEYIPDIDEIDDTIYLTEDDLDIDDNIDIIDVNDLVNNNILDIKDEEDKIYLNENDLNIDDIDFEDETDLLDDVYFDDLIDQETIDNLINDIDFEEEK